MKLVKGTSMYTLGVALFAALGTFLFVGSHDCRIEVDQYTNALTQGFDTGIVTTSEYFYPAFAESPLSFPAISHASWVEYMDEPSSGVIGSVSLLRQPR